MNYVSDEVLRGYLKNNCFGRQKSVKSPVLERVLGLRESELRKLVNRLRKKAVPIGSGPEGYFYAAHAGEIYGTIRHLKEMQNGLQEAIQGLETALEHFGEGGEQDR